MTNDSSATTSFLRPEELAKFLGISKPTVYRLIEKREIPFYKIGGSLRFKKEDVSAYLDSNRIESIQNNL